MKRIVFFLVFALSAISCKKYLEAKPDSSVTTPQTIGDLQALLDRSDYMNQKSPAFDEASADDYFLPQTGYNAVGENGRKAYVWQLDEYEWVNDWANAYVVVYNANVCLEEIEKIERTEKNAAEWDNVKGAALFFRAWTFLKLAWMYSKAYDPETAGQDEGVILRLGTDFNVPSVRSSTGQTYEQIIRDLEAAVPLLPGLSTHVLRPSRAAAFALLARTYLSMRRYEQAYDYADQSLKIKSDLMDYNGISATASSPFQSFNKEVIFHADITSYTFTNISPSNARADTMLYRSYDNDDLRKQVFFATTGGYQQFKGSYVSRTIVSRPLFTGIATDEMMLVRAECRARAGDKENALADLNTLMKNRWRNIVVYREITAENAEAALSIILKERRKELLFRGLRWMDIKRFNKEGRGIELKRIVNGQEYRLVPNSNRFALPLPADVVRITGVVQNPA